jgi:hypothetical protein
MEGPKKIEARAVIKPAQIAVQAMGDIQVNLGALHLLSATIFSRRVQELEAEHAGKEFGEFWHEIFANASGVVFMSVAALESYINELFIDYKKVFPELRTEVIAKLWKLVEQKPILEKYKFALLLKNGPAFNESARPYQDVATLINLRNALIHFKPEYFSKQDKHAKLSKSLRGKATLSPFFPQSEPPFPLGWASHATVKWAIKSTLDFILEFEKRAKIEQRMAKFKDQFNAL